MPNSRQEVSFSPVIADLLCYVLYTHQKYHPLLCLCCGCVSLGLVDPREQREQRMQREETWNTVPMTKNSRTIDPNKIPKISKVRRADMPHGLDALLAGGTPKNMRYF